MARGKKMEAPVEQNEVFMSVTMQEVMKQSGVAFGTSGARGLVTAMTDRVFYVYARSFIKYC